MKYPRVEDVAPRGTTLVGNPDVTDEVLEGMWNAIWVTAYADFVEELKNEGYTRRQIEDLGFEVAGPGDDWSEVVPIPPVNPYEEDLSDELEQAAKTLAAMYDEENDKSVSQLFSEARFADRSVPEVDGEVFGHYLAMMALGTGVSWFDEYKRFPLKVPLFEVHFDGQDINWSPSVTRPNPSVTRGGSYQPVVDAIDGYLDSPRADYPAAASDKALIDEVAEHAGWRSTRQAWFRLLRQAQDAGVVVLGRGDMPAAFGGPGRMAANEHRLLNAEFHWVRIV